MGDTLPFFRSIASPYIAGSNFAVFDREDLTGPDATCVSARILRCPAK